MTTGVTHRELVPGTTGWSVDDLDDPEVERQWCAGRFEIVEGVLTLMPAAYYDGGLALQRLIRIVGRHTIAAGLGDGFATEVDLVLARRRLARVDAIFLSGHDQEKQKQAHAQTGRRQGLAYGRVLVAPTLVIESLSFGHEAHDRETKRRWYAEAAVQNYWLLDSQEKSLECFVLDGADYRIDQSGRYRDEVRPSMFPGLLIPLAELWAE